MKSKKNGGGVKAVVIGGGTGTFTVLSSLKHYVGHISAVINMVDDGGSTGVLRDELGVLPPGDVRQSLVALSASSEVMRELFNYRFPSGTFAGHNFGNIFLTALEKVTGSFAKAVVTAGEILNISGKVVPVTTEDVHLCMRLPDGSIIKGQKNVFHHALAPREKADLFLEPNAKINPEAEKLLLDADLIIIAPGNLHSSLIPTLLVDGMAKALKESKAKKIYIVNLMTQQSQTEGFRVKDFADAIEHVIGRDVLDYVLYDNVKPPKALLDKYAKEGEKFVEADDADFAGTHYQAVGENLVSPKPAKVNPNDKMVPRVFIRHDGDRLSRAVMKIYFS